MGGFLGQLAQVFRQLPPQLFSPDPDLAGFRPGRDAGPVEPEARTVMADRQAVARPGQEGVPVLPS